MDSLQVVGLCILVGVVAWVVGFVFGYRHTVAEYSLVLQRSTQAATNLRADIRRLEQEARDARVEGMVIGHATAHSDQRRETRSAGVPVAGVRSDSGPPRPAGRSRVVMIDGEAPEIEASATALPNIEVVQVTVDLSDATLVENLSQATAALRRGRAIIATTNNGTLRVCRIPVGFYTEIRSAGDQPVRLLLDTAKDVNAWLRRHFRS